MGIEMDKPANDMTLPEVADRCTSESAKYSRKEPHDEQYCLEIFRRAMVEGNSEAWVVLHQRFSSILLGWVRRHPQREAAYRCDNENNYVDRAFRRLWVCTIGNQALEFNSLSEVQSFLLT